MHLQKGAFLGASLRALSHELGHAYQFHIGLNQSKHPSQEASRSAYVETRIRDEAYAKGFASQIYKELGVNRSLMFKPDRWNMDKVMQMNLDERQNYFYPKYWGARQ